MSDRYTPWGRDQPGEGRLSTWQGIDIVVGVTVSWIPPAVDYTRFARTERGAFRGLALAVAAANRRVGARPARA